MEQQVQEQVTQDVQPDYENMPMNELREAAFPAEGAAPVQQQTEQATAEPKETVTPEQPPQAKPDEPPAWFRTFAENTKRELGSHRGTMSQLQKLQQELAELKAARQTQETNPETQQAEAEQAAVRKQIQELAIQGVLQQFKPQIEVLQKLEQQQQDDNYKGDVFSLVSKQIPEFPKAWNDIWEENANKIEAGDQDAIAWQERALKEPAFLALEMLNRKSAEVQSKSAEFVQGRQKAGAQAAQVVKQGAVQAQAKKSLNEMTQAELDALPTDELRARTEAEGHFKG